jgi:hypothetical protein
MASRGSEYGQVLWTAEETDETRRALGAAGQFGKELVPSATGRQVARLQIGGDQSEGIMVRRAASRARSHISRKDAIRGIRNEKDKTQNSPPAQRG